MNKSRGYTIEERTNNGKTYYRVKYYNKGKRKSATFRTRTDAESFANALTTANTMPHNFDVALVDILLHLKFKEVCKQAGITIDDGYDMAINHIYACLTNNLTPNIVSFKTVTEAALEFAEVKRHEGRRANLITQYEQVLAIIQSHYLGVATKEDAELYFNGCDATEYINYLKKQTDIALPTHKNYKHRYRPIMKRLLCH